jgi:hypothetical protein
MEKSRREVCYARAGVFGPNHHAIAITAEHERKYFFYFPSDVSRLLILIKTFFYSFLWLVSSSPRCAGPETAKRNE